MRDETGQPQLLRDLVRGQLQESDDGETPSVLVNLKPSGGKTAGGQDDRGWLPVTT